MLQRLWVGRSRRALICLITLALCFLSVFALTARSEPEGWTATWIRKADPPPGPRGWVDLAFDTVNGRAVLFGGGASWPLNDVWWYDAAVDRWTQLEADSRCSAGFTPPTGREEYALEYDPTNQLIWIFGGSGTGCTGPGRVAQAGSTASTLVDSTLPATTVDFYKHWTVSIDDRKTYVSAYDPRSKALTLATPLVGARPGAPYYLYPQRGGGTFSYSPTTRKWSGLTGPYWGYTGPEPINRLSPAMAYSTRDRAMVMFGGQGTNDTWALDVETKSWVQMIAQQQVASPPGLAQITNSMVYDSNNDLFILFGGCLCTGDWGPSSGDTWAYRLSTNTWTRMTPAVSPPRRQANNLIYDSVNKVAVLFGGFDAPSATYYNDLWVYSYSSNSWTQVFPPVSPPARRIGAMAYDPFNQLAILYGGEDESNGSLRDAWILRLEAPRAATPTPALTSLSRDTAIAGEPAFTLIVTGANFGGSSIVRWNGAGRPTKYVRSTRLEAGISASDLANGGVIPISVTTDGRTSSSLTFTVMAPAPAPALNSISPNSATAGRPFTLTATGGKFFSTSVLRVNGSTRATTVTSPTQLSATLLVSDVANAGSLNISVFTPGPGGGASASRSLTVTAPPPAVSTPPAGSSTPVTTAPTAPIPTASSTGSVAAPSSTSAAASVPSSGSSASSQSPAVRLPAQGSWAAFPNSALRSAMGQAPWNPAYIFDYSGGWWDEARQELGIWGGGHGDYPGNEVCTFPLAIGAWTCGPRSPWQANVTQDALADGNPSARHTYSSIVRINLPGWDGLFVHGGSLWQGGNATAAAWFYHRDTTRWEPLPPTGTDYSSASLADKAVWNPIRKVVHARVRNGLRDYDPLAKAWAWKGAADWNESEQTGAFDPERQIFLIVGKAAYEVYDTSTTPWTPKAVTLSGDLTPVNAWGPGLVFDPVAKRYLLYAGGQAIYSLDRDSWVISKLPASGDDPGPAYDVGTFGRFQYIPRTNGLIVVNSIDSNVFYFQLGASSAGTASTPTASSTTSSASTSSTSSSIPPSTSTSTSTSTSSSTSSSTPTSTSTSTSTSPVGTSTTTGSSMLLDTWVAIKDATDPTLFYVEKHATVAYSPALKRFFLTGGDTRKNVLGPGNVGLGSSSYQQRTISVDLNARLAAPGNVNAGWQLEYPYCSPAGQVQPKHPDFVGFSWAPWLGTFISIPGEYVGSGPPSDCVGETAPNQDDPQYLFRHIVTFDPTTRTWADVSKNHGAQDTGNDYPWHGWADPVRKLLIRIESGMIDEYNPATDSWAYFRTAIRNEGVVDDHKSFLAVDETKRILYTVDRCSHRWTAYDLDARTARSMGALPGSIYSGMSVCGDKGYVWFVQKARKIVYAEIVPGTSPAYRIWTWAVDDPAAAWQRIDTLPNMTLDGEPLPAGEMPHGTTGAVDTDRGILFLTGEYDGFGTNGYSWVIQLSP